MTLQTKLSYKNLLLTTLPAICAVVIEPIAGFVDTAFVGQLSSRWLAGLALCVTIFSSFTWIFNFLVHAVTARVANNLGSGNLKDVDADIKMALLVAIVAGVALAGILLLCERILVVNVMVASPQLADEISDYFFYRALGLPAVLVVNALTGVLRGLQKIGQSFAVLLIVTLINIVLTYLFLYVFQMSLTGAAIGTSLSFAVGVVAGLFFLLQKNDVLKVRSGMSELSFGQFLDFGQEAINMFGRTAALTTAFFLATVVASRFGEAKVAAYQVGYQFWIFAAFLHDGLSITATSMGGLFVGQGRFDLYQTLGRRLLLIGFIVGCLFALVYGVAEPYLVRIFSNDPAILAIVGTFWFVIVWAQPLNAFAFAYDGLLFGSKDFKFLRRRMIEGLLLVYIPILAYGYFEVQSVIWIWFAFVGLNIYRCATSSWHFFRIKIPG